MTQPHKEMTPIENLRLRCLQLAANHLGQEPHNIQTLISWAQKFYDFVAEPTEIPTTSDPEQHYAVSYIAEKPTGAISREWLTEKLGGRMRHYIDVRENSGTDNNYYYADGCVSALLEVINLINPKKQC